MVYAGGFFTNVGGQARSRIAALDPVTGLATAWNPGAGGSVRSVLALALSGNVVYAGGVFAAVGGQVRNHLAALDATSGLATLWNPLADTSVLAIAAKGGVVYVGGRFTTIGGQARNRIAALDTTSGLATAWNPDADGDVYSVATSGGSVIVGGVFFTLGGQARRQIGSCDAVSGAVTDWNPNMAGLPWALATAGDTVIAVGTFSTVGGQNIRGVVRMLPAGPAPAVTVLSPDGGETFAFGDTCRVTWTASAVAPGLQSIDLQLSRNGTSGPWESIAAGLPDTGTYRWVAAAPFTNAARVRVIARDYAGVLGTDVSTSDFVIGATVGVTLILCRRLDWSKRLPYGPYIALAAVIWLFSRAHLLGWMMGR